MTKKIIHFFRTTDSYIWCSTKWGNQPQSEYIEAFSKSFKGLETQINIWETFIVNSTNVNQDDAMLFFLNHIRAISTLHP
ncbi:hypothetical protein ABR759_04525 [Escherichia coli]